MNSIYGKFVKGFVFGLASAEASLILALQKAGCHISSIGDLKAVGVAALAGLFAGVLHALWSYMFPGAPMVGKDNSSN